MTHNDQQLADLLRLDARGIADTVRTGEVSAVDEASGSVTVMINIFGRSTPVQFDYWHLEAV